MNEKIVARLQVHSCHANNATRTLNELLAEIANQITAISDFFVGAYDAIEGYADFQPVSDVAPITRIADPDAVRVVVANGGVANPVYVKENDNIIAIVPPDSSLTLPTSGKGVIILYCATGESSSVALATYRNTD